MTRIHPRGMQARDCVIIGSHAGTGHSSRSSTADRHFDNLLGITRLDPLILYQDAGSPDIATLL